MEELPRRGEVATEFRNLTAMVGNEVFQTAFPAVYRLLQETQENFEQSFSETTSGIRSLEIAGGRLEESVSNMNFELYNLLAYQNEFLRTLEGLNQSVSVMPTAGGLLSGLFKGRKKVTPAGKETAKSGKPGAKGAAEKTNPAEKGSVGEKVSAEKVSGGGILTRTINYLAVLMAMNEALDRIKKLDPKDPEYYKKATQEVSAVAGRFGVATVAAVAGAMMFSRSRNLVKLAAGLAAGAFVDTFFGDSVEAITKGVVEKIWEGTKALKDIKFSNPFISPAAAATRFDENVFTNNTKQLNYVEKNTETNTTQPVNVGSQMIVSSIEDDNITASSIIFKAKRMMFIGDNMMFNNIEGIGDSGKSKTASRTEQNRASEEIEKLKEKNDEGISDTTPGQMGGDITPGSTTGSGSGMGSGSTPGGSSGGGTGAGAGSITFGDKPAGQPFSGSQDEAFKRMEAAAAAAGSPDPKVTASIAMLESGWLKSSMTQRANNPFGQTITRSQIGTEGIVGGTTGADGQLHAVYDSLESAVKHHIRKWGGRYTNDPQQTLRNLVGGGYNTVNAQWAPHVYNIYQKSSGASRVTAANNQATPSATAPATPVDTPPRTNAPELRARSADVTSAPIESPDRVREVITRTMTNSAQPQQQNQNVIVNPTSTDVPAPNRLIEAFTNSP